MRNDDYTDDIDFDRDYDTIRQIQPPPSRGGYYIAPDRRRFGGRNRRGLFGGFPTALIAAVLAFVLGSLAGFGGGYLRWGHEKPYTVDLKSIKAPDWIDQVFIRKNIFSRPDVSLKRIRNIVIHYVGNPGTSAQANRNYFDSLADQDPQSGGSSSSAHFIVGLDGEILQCIPVSEMAYANAPRNNDTIAVETCHPDETGKYNQETYDSLVKLTAWLCLELELSPNDVIRHYDVSEKGCPKYFVDNEDAWKQFKKDVKEALKEMK